jgi:YVTN family beta-propeller protein
MRAVLVAAVAALLGSPSTLTVDAGEAAYGIAAGGGSVWVGGLDAGDVLRVDPATGHVLRRIPVGVRTFNLASAPGAVWAVSNNTSTATRIDTRTGRVTAKVSVGSAPYDVAWGSVRRGSRTPVTAPSRASPANAW